MKKLLTETELAEHIGVHRNTLRSWRERGCPYTGGTRSLRYDPELVLEWRKQKDIETPGGTGAREVIDAKHAFLAESDLYRQIDAVRAKLPEELQDDFETLANEIVHVSFEAGWRARA